MVSDPERVDVDTAIGAHIAKRLLEQVADPTCTATLEEGATCGVLAAWLMSLSCGHSHYLCQPHQTSVRAQTIAAPPVCMSPAPPSHPLGMRISIDWRKL